MDAQQASEFVQTYFPPLAVQSTVNNVVFHGLNAKEFFEVFFADNAPFGFEAFHKIRKDKDVEYGQWETLTNVQKPCLLSSAPSISGMDSSQPSQAASAIPSIQERIVTFSAKTNSMFGPPFAPTTKVQRAMQVSKNTLVLEIKTTLTDIPFANRFYLMERWMVTSESVREDDIDSRKRTDHHRSKSQSSNKATKPRPTSRAYLTVTSQVFFTKSCPFEATVHKESAKTINEICTQWNKMAQEALKRTEETRRQRIQEEKMENLDDDDMSMDDDHHSVSLAGGDDGDETATASSSDGDTTVPTSCPPVQEEVSIEIEHVGKQKSWIAGDDRPIMFEVLDENNDSHSDKDKSQGSNNPIASLASFLIAPAASSWRSTFQRRESSTSNHSSVNDKMGGSERLSSTRRRSKTFSNMLRNDRPRSSTSDDDYFARPFKSTPSRPTTRTEQPETTTYHQPSSPILDYHGLTPGDCPF